MATGKGVAKGKVRDVELERRWRHAMSEQSRSGLSVRAFCRQRNLLESRFFSWRRELRRRDAQREQRPSAKSPSRRERRASGSSGSPSFVPVRVAADGGGSGGVGGVGRSAGGHMEIILSCGRRVCVAGPVDRAALADVLSVLEGLPAAGAADSRFGRSVGREASSC